MKKVASFILAFVFLGSNLGFAVGTHFCGGHAMETEVMLGYDDLSCGMMPEAAVDTNHEHPSIHSVPCCLNEFSSLQIEDDFDSAPKATLQATAILISLFVVADYTFDFNPKSNFILHAPPALPDDVSIRLQVFRI